MNHIIISEIKMFNWFKKRKELFYHKMNKRQFDSYIRGNVIGFIWEPEEEEGGVRDDKIREIESNYKKLLFSLPGAFIEAVPCVCLYYDFQDDHSVFHMYFQQPVKAEFVVGQGFKMTSLIYKNKENEHLTTQAKIQIALNQSDVETKNGRPDII